MANYLNKIKQIMSKLGRHQLAVLVIISSLILIILAVCGILLSQRAWSDYESGYAKNINNAQADIDNVITNILPNANISSTNKINDLSQIQVRLTQDMGTYCVVDKMVGWQNFIKQLSDKMSVCSRQKENLRQLLEKVGNVVAYLQAEQSLSATISKAVNETDQNNQADKWKNIEAYWRQAATDVSILTDVYLFNATKAAAVSSINNIADSWQRLSSANDARDRSKFEAERTNLTKVYVGLTTISDVSVKQFNTLITELNTSYKKINGGV